MTPGSPSGLADGQEEVRRTVRELVRVGADVIKVATSGGVLSYGDQPHHAQFGRDELAVMVAEAAAAGRWVMAHAQSTAGIRNAVEGGVHSLEHGVYLDDATIELMLDRGTWLVPTLLAVEGALAGAGTLPERVLLKAQAVREAHRDSVRRAIAAGVPIAMGTDCPVSPHGTNLGELALLQELGMSPEEALAAATGRAADLLGRDDLGILAPGRRVAGSPCRRGRSARRHRRPRHTARRHRAGLDGRAPSGVAQNEKPQDLGSMVSRGRPS